MSIFTSQLWERDGLRVEKITIKIRDYSKSSAKRKHKPYVVLAGSP